MLKNGIEQPKTQHPIILVSEQCNNRVNICFTNRAISNIIIQSFERCPTFRIFGITNNFGYVVMLSAAFDLIKDDVSSASMGAGHEEIRVISG